MSATQDNAQNAPLDADAWLAMLAAIDEKPKRMVAARAVLRQPEQLRLLAETDLEVFEADLKALVTSDLAALIAKKAAAARPKSPPPGAAPPPTASPEPQRSLAEELGRADLSGDLRVPDGWGCSQFGISHVVELKDGGTEERPITARPLIVTGLLLDVDSSRRELVIEWQRERGGWETATLPPSTTQDPRAFVALRDQGAPISLGNARRLAGWIDAFTEANASVLPAAASAKRLGWVGDGSRGFLWGDTLISQRGDRSTSLPPSEWGNGFVRLAIPADDGRAQLAAGFHAKGTLDGWKQQVAIPLLDHPRVLIFIYASLAAAFLGPVIPDAPNAIVHLSGETSKGKTTTLRAGGSCWGRPDLDGEAVMRTWDASPSAIEQYAEVSSCVPLILDDTKRAMTRDPESKIVASMIYQVAAGQGRGRARPDGMRRMSTWRTILLSSGEAPATSHTNDAGARARVLEVHGAPLPQNAAFVASLTAGLLDHYGHAGPEVVRHLAERPEAWPELRALYAERVAFWTSAAGDSQVAGRLAQTIALIELGAMALHDWLGVPRPAKGKDPLVEIALAGARSGSDQADRASAALAAVYGWSVQHQSEFWGRHQLIDSNAGDNDPGNARQPMRGWAGVWRRNEWEEIAFVPDALRRILAHLDFAPADVLPLWKERGWLKQDGAHLGTPRRVAGERQRCVVLSKDIIGRAIGEVPTTTAPALPFVAESEELPPEYGTDPPDEPNL